MLNFKYPGHFGKGIFAFLIGVVLVWPGLSCEEAKAQGPRIEGQLFLMDSRGRATKVPLTFKRVYNYNYCKDGLLESLADSIQVTMKNVDGTRRLWDSIYFFTELHFIRDTFCLEMFPLYASVFRDKVVMDSCTFLSDKNGEALIYGACFNSIFYLTSTNFRSKFGFRECVFSDVMRIYLRMSDTAFNEISFYSCVFKKDLLLINYEFSDENNDFLDELVWQPVIANDVYFEANTFNGNLSMSHLTFQGNITFLNCFLPDTINFTGSNFKGEIKIPPSKDGKQVNLLISSDFPVQKLNSVATNFNLVFDSSVSTHRKEFLLSQSVELQKKIGSALDIETADVTHKDFKAAHGDVFLKLQKFLWNYGYDKPLLLKRILYSFILFFVLNLFLFRVLINEVYTISNLKAEYDHLKNYKNRRLRFYRYPTIVLLYSSIIFFGWKMDLDKFSFRHLLLSLYIFFFYLIGLLLLFYFLGLILYK